VWVLFNLERGTEFGGMIQKNNESAAADNFSEGKNNDHQEVVHD